VNGILNREKYNAIVSAWQRFRAWIDTLHHRHPELFPQTFKEGYKLHDHKTSPKTGVMTRRIGLKNGQVWTVHPIVISRWKAQLLDNAATVFQDGRSKKKSDETNVDELYQKIGRLEVELDWIKKKSDDLC
jgi:hypothetical protein